MKKFIDTPRSLDEFVGNEEAKELIRIHIAAREKTDSLFPHTILTGATGCGKTILATLIAKELNEPYKIISAKAIQTEQDLNNLLLSLPKDCVLIIDEIHDLKHALSDLLHQPMDDFSYSFVDKKTNTIMNAPIEPFTLIGITRNEGRLTSRFYSRFTINIHLEPYSYFNLQTIIMNVARNNGIKLVNNAAYEIAKRSNETPRIAIGNFTNCWRYAVNKYTVDKVIDINIVNTALRLFGIDKMGLEPAQQKIVKALSNKPIGIKKLARIIDVDEQSIQKVYEPFLVRSGLVSISRAGRTLTTEGLKHKSRLGLNDKR